MPAWKWSPVNCRTSYKTGYTYTTSLISDVYLCVHQSVCLSVCLSARLSICLSTYIYRFVCTGVYLPVYLSVSLLFVDYNLILSLKLSVMHSCQTFIHSLIHSYRTFI